MAINTYTTSITVADTWVKCSDPAPQGGMTVNINVVNRTAAKEAMGTDICISTNLVSPADTDWLEHTARVAFGYPLMRTGEPLKEGEIIYVRVNKINATVRVSGFDKL